MYFLIKIKYYCDGIFFYILIKIESNTAKKT